MIFRDDDISHTTDLAAFHKVHNFFREAIVLHTIALIVKDIDTNPELVDYIKTQNIDVQIHCWTHYDLTSDIEQAEKDLKLCIDTIEEVLNERPTTLYPPWNKTSKELEIMACHLGLRVSTEKGSLEHYILNQGNVDYDVINFHYWAQQEIILLEPALKIYNTLR